MATDIHFIFSVPFFPSVLIVGLHCELSARVEVMCGVQIMPPCPVLGSDESGL